VNILRRLPLSRLLLLCGVAVAVGASATAIAFALGSGPTPPPKPLADAVHEALTAPPVEGVSANVQLTDHLLEGANLASNAGGEVGQLFASPLLSGASGRLWISKDGRVRLELQAEKGDTQVLYDGHTLTVYDASTNTLYRVLPPCEKLGPGQAIGPSGAGSTTGAGATQTRLTYRPCETSEPDRSGDHHEAPSVAKIEEGISKLGEHANVSGATPTDVAGQPAYTVRVSPKEGGSLIGGAELSWDAVHGVPLRAAIYSSTSSSPVIELAASSVSYGPVEESVFDVTPPANAKVEDVMLPSRHDLKGKERQGGGGGEADARGDRRGRAHGHGKVTVQGHGVTGVAVLESRAKPGEKPLQLPQELPKVKVGEATAAELSTALGTLLSFERSGVRYLLVGAVPPADVEAVARGL
jgi:outer membrane lipoprotein-sorting protein